MTAAMRLEIDIALDRISDALGDLTKNLKILYVSRTSDQDEVT